MPKTTGSPPNIPTTTTTSSPTLTARLSEFDAAKGLTRSEAENAFSLSLVRHGSLRPPTLWELKGQQLKKAASSRCTVAPRRSNSSAAWTTSRRSVCGPCVAKVSPAR